MEPPINLNAEELEQLIQRAQERPYQVAENPLEKCDRLSGQFQIVHESCSFEAVVVKGGFSILLRGKEQPYQRRLEATLEPRLLNFELAHPGFLVVENKSKPPSLAKEEEVMLFVSIASLCFPIGPGRPFMIEFLDERQYYLHASAPCPAVVTVFPR